MAHRASIQIPRAAGEHFESSGSLSQSPVKNFHQGIFRFGLILALPMASSLPLHPIIPSNQAPPATSCTKRPHVHSTTRGYRLRSYSRR